VPIAQGRLARLAAKMRRVLIHPVSTSTFIRLIGISAGILGSVVVARVGGPDLKGVASAFAAANAICFMFLNFDLAQQSLREARNEGNFGLVIGSLKKAWLFYALIGAGALAVAVFSEAPLAWIIGGSVAYVMGAQAGVAATGLSGASVGSWGAIVQQAALIAGVLLGWWLGWLNSDTIKWAIIVSYLVPMAVFVPVLISHRSTRVTVTYRDIVTMARSGGPWQLGRLAQVVLQKLDTVVIFVWIGASAAGIYSVGLSTAMLCTLIPSQFASHALFEATNKRDHSPTARLAQALIVGLVCAVALALIGDPLLRFAYGESFAGAYPVLLASLPGAVAYGVVQVESNYMRILGGWKAFLIFGAVGVGVMALSLLIMVPLFGLLGAAAAFSLGAVATALVGLLSFRKKATTAE
jgi:O-antigen/teichoic acid export membrane protein